MAREARNDVAQEHGKRGEKSRRTGTWEESRRPRRAACSTRAVALCDLHERGDDGGAVGLQVGAHALGRLDGRRRRDDKPQQLQQRQQERVAADGARLVCGRGGRQRLRRAARARERAEERAGAAARRRAEWRCGPSGGAWHGRAVAHRVCVQQLPLGVDGGGQRRGGEDRAVVAQQQVGAVARQRARREQRAHGADARGAARRMRARAAVGGACDGGEKWSTAEACAGGMQTGREAKSSGEAGESKKSKQSREIF
eukprot:5351674-Pleurochrysis_carterae.AAC.2